MADSNSIVLCIAQNFQHAVLNSPFNFHFNFQLFNTRSFDIEEIGHFDEDGAVGTSSEGVFLCAPEDVAQAIEVTPFHDEVMPVLGADVKSRQIKLNRMELQRS